MKDKKIIAVLCAAFVALTAASGELLRSTIGFGAVSASEGEKWDCTNPTLGHSIDNVDWTTDETSHWKVCKECGGQDELGEHTETSKVTRPATVDEEGEKTFTCSVCGKVRTETTPKLEADHQHSYSEDWKSDSENHWKECDCGEKIDSAAHTEDDGKITVEATTTAAGLKTYSCKVCGYVIRTETVDKLPTPTPDHEHSFTGEWQKDDKNHWKVCDTCEEAGATTPHTENEGVTTLEPTTDHEGVKTYSCTVCGSVIRTETISKLGEETKDDETKDEENKTDEDGNKTDEDGNKTDEDGNKSDEDGNKTDEDGNKTDEDGNKTDEDDNKTDEDGNKSDEDDNKTDEDNSTDDGNTGNNNTTGNSGSSSSSSTNNNSTTSTNNSTSTDKAEEVQPVKSQVKADNSTAAAKVSSKNKVKSVSVTASSDLKDKKGNSIDPASIKLGAKEIFDTATLKKVKKALGTEIIGDKHFNLLDLSLRAGSTDISTSYDGFVSVTIAIPTGYKGKNFKLYRLVENNGTMTALLVDGKLTSDGYTAYLGQFGRYVLVAED